MPFLLQILINSDTSNTTKTIEKKKKKCKKREFWREKDFKYVMRSSLC